MYRIHLVGRLAAATATCVMALSMTQVAAGAAAGPSVHGGGVVDGVVGTTSQLGFDASASGGHFLCIMAGRSGGFPFGPWQSITQMEVSGPVSPGTLRVEGGVATFAGTATIHVVGRTATGEVLTATVEGVPYVSIQTPGGAGVAEHELDVTLPSGTATFGPAPLRSGHISVTG